MSITEDSINTVTIEEALSMVNNCQTNEACESALSSLPYVQGEIRENEMESLKNDFEFVREAIWLDYKDYACGLQNEKKQQDLDGLGQLAWQVWSRVVLEAKDLWVFWRTVVLPKLASYWREVIGMVTAPRPENENSPGISVALKEFLTNEYLTDFFSLENSRKVLSIVGPDANAFALRRYNECTCSKFKLSVEVKSPGDKATILADILQEVRKRAQEQESSDHVEPSVATPGEIMDYQESDDDVAMNEIQKGLMKNKYVILIMDLNEEGTWKDIEGALPDNNFRSRVIITTRRWEVAQICSSGESDMIYRPLVGQERAVEVENVKSFSHGSIASVMGIGKDEWVKKELPDKIAGLSKQALQEWVSGKVQVVEPCNDFISLKLKVSGADFKHPPPCAWDPNMQMQFLGRVAVLDIRVCQLQDDHLKKLGEMSVLHTLALALAGVQKQKMTITSGSFQKLEVFELDSHVPWVTFQDGAMPELVRLCLKLYAGPKGKTPSGTNHLNKLHEVTLEYSEEYEDCACVKETVAAMKKESCMRRRPSAIIISLQGELTFPSIQVSDCMNANLAKQVRVVMLFLFDYVFAMHLPGAGKIRPLLAKMPRWQLSVAIPFLVLLSYYKLIMLLRTKPLVLLVATWLANRVLPIILLLPLHEQIQKVNPRWTIITSVVIGYKIACILFPIARLCYKAHKLCTTTRDWFFWELPPLVLVYILRAVWHRLPTLILVFPIVLLIILFHRLAAMSRKFMSLPFLALFIYFLPSFSYSVISGILLNVGPLTKWLIWGWGA